MPQIDHLQSARLPTGRYGYSHTPLPKLQASEYTIVGLLLDTSGSTMSFRPEMEKVVQNVVDACNQSPRRDNLLLRCCAFDNGLHELHGFIELSKLNPASYSGAIQRNSGDTALYDAAENSSAAINDYAKQLRGNGFMSNGILIVVTDGCDNASGMSVQDVRAAFTKVVRDELLESFVSILIAINLTDPGARLALEEFHREAGFTQFVDMGEVDDKKMARLAAFVSKSITSQSKALGSGTASKTLTF